MTEHDVSRIRPDAHNHDAHHALPTAPPPTIEAPSSPDHSSTPDIVGTPDRRRFVRYGVAAAGAAATAIVANAAPAAAANGDAVTIGQANSGTATTTLTGSRLQINTSANASTSITAQNTGDNGFGVLGLASKTTTGVGVKGQGKTGVEGDGNFPGGVGVSGYGPTGVKGQSPANNGVGVSGIATGPTSTGLAGVGTSTGVYGEGEVTGIAAFSNGGDGLNVHTDGTAKRALIAEADGAGGIGVEVDAPFGPALRLRQGPAIPPTTGTWVAGDVVMHAGLWLCIVGGIGPATRWVKLSRTYQPLAAPVRIYDSRPGNTPLGVVKGKTTAGGERVIDSTIGAGVPAGVASAVEVNVTVTDTDTTGWLALFANGVAWPGTSTINWSATGTIVANSVTVAVDALARFKVRAAGATHFVCDVTGYYT